MEEAILNNDIDTVKYLLEEGCDPNTKTETGTPLLFLNENLEILTLLLDYGADATVPDENGFILEDYCDDDSKLLLLKKPRNAMIVTQTKAIKYKETFKLKHKRAKTLKAKSIRLPEQSD